MNVTVSFTININAAEWEGRKTGVPAQIGVVPPHIRARITEEVQSHAENVVRDLYADMGWTVEASETV
jgi:hypothetical protein